MADLMAMIEATATRCKEDVALFDQLRCMVTAWCICNDIEVDTLQWDTLIARLAVLCGTDTDLMDMYMCKFLV